MPDDKNTVVKLLAELGCACAEFHAEHVRGVKAKRVECDEIWSFVRHGGGTCEHYGEVPFKKCSIDEARARWRLQ